ncbi:MAG: hypothetical protein PUB84_05650 [Bacteroidales bacterium]|nr:hypothetical protein [Bacteroidales bacterium]MDD6554817.1 hypothetical protein [Bacteroidales bacterium]
MDQFPKWMLALAGVNLLPLLASPFFLFGNLTLCQGHTGVLYLLFYLLTQLAWVLPLAAFFVSLDLYRRGFETAGVVIVLAGWLIAAVGVWLLL